VGQAFSLRRVFNPPSDARTAGRTEGAMSRIIGFWYAVLAAFFCCWGWIENTWAAGFDGPYRPVFPFRAEVFLGLLAASLPVSLVLAWKWIRRAARACLPRNRRRSRLQS